MAKRGEKSGHKSGRRSGHVRQQKHEHEADIHIRVGVITISTTKWDQYGQLTIQELNDTDDESGKVIVNSLSDFVIEYRLTPDDIIKIQKEINSLLERVDVVITTGGTGITPSDITVEAIEPLLSKRLDGFGEIYRSLSYKEIGGAALISRTFAGTIGEKVIFCLPGSPKAVKLGVKLIKESIKHIVSHAKGLK